ncbi:sensor domain-containing diguanylate cyclase [Pseudomonas sp. Marseille-QA0892]
MTKRYSSIALRIYLTTFALGLMLLAGNGYARETQRDVLVLGGTDRSTRLDAAGYAEYLLAPIDEPFAAIAAMPASDWRSAPGGILSLGYQPEGAWIRLRVSNRGQEDHDWLLTVDLATLERMEVRLYDPTSGAWSLSQLAGNAVRSDHQPMDGRYPAFRLAVPAGQTRIVYAHATSFDHLNLPISVVTEGTWLRDEARVIPLLTAFFGAMCAMLIYNGSLWAFTRDRSYAWYCLYLACSIGYTMTMTGLGSQYLWGDMPAVASRILPLSVCTSFAAAGLFIRAFLNLEKRGGVLLTMSSLLIGYWVVASTIVAMAPSLFPRLGIYQAGFISCLAAFGTAIRLWQEGNTSARYFTIGWSLLYVSTGYLTLALAGFVSMSPLPVHLQLFGFTVEFLVLSIGLAQRINRERAARLRAQREALFASEQLGLERLAVLRAEQDANIRLEQRVQERTRALNASNQALAAANAMLSDLSQRDALTGLFNRRHFDAMFDAAVSAASDTSHISVALLDIDHFKRVNDTYGHTVGDYCIVSVADVLRRYTQRSGECAARFGGEEFILMFNNLTESALRSTCERIRREIEALQIDADGAAVRFTVSIGAICARPAPMIPRERYSRSADEALYRAKAEGRNRVCMAVALCEEAAATRQV